MSQINKAMFLNINLDISENKTQYTEWLKVFPRAMLPDSNLDLASCEKKLFNLLVLQLALF